MKTITFTPHSDLDRLDAEFRVKLAEALMISIQYKGHMSNSDDSAHCCLCVAARLEGATEKDYGRHGLPRADYAPTAFRASGVYAATSRGSNYVLSDLNDKFLTHPQIAELLKGNTVTIEVDS